MTDLAGTGTGEPNASSDEKITYFKALRTCRICRFVTMAAFLALVVVEALILVPSYFRYEQDLLARYEAISLNELRAVIAISPPDVEAPLLARVLNQAVDSTVIKGGAIYDDAGRQLALFGEPPLLAYRPAGDTVGEPMMMAYDMQRRDRYDVVWSAPDLNGNYAIVARLDVSEVQPQLRAFVWRIVGLVMLIAVAVTAVTMFIIGRYVLGPILILRGRLQAAAQRPAEAERFQFHFRRKDELGDVIGAFNAMLVRIGEGIRELQQKRAALAEANDDLEAAVMARTRELQQANNDLKLQILDRERAEAQVRHLATHDAVTGLPNATLFSDRLEQAVIECHASQQLLAVMGLVIDNFDRATEGMEPSERHALLASIADRLRAAVFDIETLARLSGSEFGIMLPGLTDPDDASRKACALLEAVRQPLEIGGKTYRMTASIGLSVSPTDGTSAGDLLRHADLAKSRAMADGGDRASFFVPDLDERMRAQRKLEDDLRIAVAQRQFEVYYQPKVCMKTGKITGCEALVRWRRDDGTLVSPGEFVPLAERTGLIIPIGEQVLREACAQAQAWTDLGFGHLHVAVNLSAVQFRNADLVDTVGRILTESGIDPARVELEITESTVMDDLDQTLAILHGLTRLGAKVVIDDFGTGYSSLAYLRRFPVTKMKIDRSFVIDIETDEDAKTIAGAVIQLAHALNLEVVAEGIETRDQGTYLQGELCDEGQGYLFGRPMPAGDFEAWLKTPHDNLLSA